MPGLLERKPNRRRARVRARNRVRPYLEELETRTVFAVGSAAFPAALAASQLGPFPAAATTTVQPAAFSGPTSNPAPTGAQTGASPFTTQPGLATLGAPFSAGPAATPTGAFNSGAFPLTTGAGPALAGGSTVLNGINPLALGQLGALGGGALNPGGGNLLVIAPPMTTSLGEPLSSSNSPVVVVQPQSSNVSPATLTPESLPLSSSANLNVLDPANYLLARSLNSALKAGNLPSLLVMQTQETQMEPGGNAGGGGANPLNSAGGLAPAEAPPPDNQEQMQQQIQEAIRFLASTRPVTHDGDAAADHGPAAPEGATPLGEPQAAATAEAPPAAVSADGDE